MATGTIVSPAPRPEAVSDAGVDSVSGSTSVPVSDSGNQGAASVSDLVEFYRTRPDYAKKLTSAGFHMFQGKILKMVAGPGGTPLLVEAQPGELPVPDSQEELGQKVSEYMYRELDAKTQAIIRKIALNPTVYQGHAWVTSKGLFEGDLGDWICHCCSWTLDKGYGARPIMMTGRPSALSHLQKQEASP